MNRISVLAGVAAASGLLLSAAPAAAEILKLDCSVSVDTYNVGEGREGANSGSSRGVWKVRAVHFPDSDLAPEVSFDEASPFGMPYRRGGLDVDYLEGYDDEPTISQDRIEWCPDRRGCGAQIPFLSGDGWYSVSRAVVDRRRGTLSLKVEYYSSLAGVRMALDYYGTCAPEPERQF
jgi:hypothetical protein